jgi:hypothetical protein
MNRLGLVLMTLVLLVASANANWAFTDQSAHFTGLPSNASCVAWGDINGDGTPDLFVGSGNFESSAIYTMNGGTFDNASNLYGLDVCHATYVKSAQLIDYDQDGYMDIVLVRSDNIGIQILKQNSAQTFESILPAVGQTQDQSIQSALWTDLNHDGSLELVISNGTAANASLVALAHVGRDFVAMRDNPLPSNLSTVGAMTAVDYDQNGTMDWFVGTVNSDGAAHLYRNVDGQYEDWAERFGIPQKAGATGAVWFDYNNDHQLDLFLPGDENTMGLYKSTPRYGVLGLEAVNPTTLRTAIGAEYAYPVDANMDGWTDLFVTKSNGEGCALLINEEGHSWSNMASALNIENLHVSNLSAAWADFDQNGTPDLAIAQGTAGVRLYTNSIALKREFYRLNLLNSDGTGITNCSVYMELENAKALATTCPTLCATGGNESTITLVSYADRKADFGFVAVTWPNGTTTEYNVADLVRGGITNLNAPISFEPPLLADPMTDRTPQVEISPNPFNPSTSLSFTLATAGTVDLRIYNALGQEVATLASGQFAQGAHRLNFNAASLPSGLYFARMNTMGKTAVSRLLLAK